MARILKYTIPCDGLYHEIALPSGEIINCKFLDFQNHDFCFWYYDNTPIGLNTALHKRKFILIPTGQEFNPEGMAYIGSAQSTKFPGLDHFVLHLFEKIQR